MSTTPAPVAGDPVIPVVSVAAAPAATVKKKRRPLTAVVGAIENAVVAGASGVGGAIVTVVSIIPNALKPQVEADVVEVKEVLDEADKIVTEVASDLQAPVAGPPPTS